MERENLSTYSTSFLLSAIAMGIELHTYVQVPHLFYHGKNLNTQHAFDSIVRILLAETLYSKKLYSLSNE